MVDHSEKTPTTSKRTFESGTTLICLADKYDVNRKVSFQYNGDEYWECLGWMM